MGFFPLVDYWSWADDLDVVADDAYPDPGDPAAPAEAALTQDLMRSLGGGRPWILMEQAVGAVSWRGHNLPKSPARSRLESIQAVARGADGVCFFQWRASRAGAERFHSAMLPHAGADTRVHEGVRRLGADLRRLRPVVGARVPARVALLFDWESWWAAHELARPTTRLDTLAQLRAWYRPLWDAGVAADVVRPGADLGGYDVVLVPQTYVLDERSAERLAEAADRGASLVVGPFTGVADVNAHVRTGRFPVLLRGVLGVSGEEWAPLPDDGTDLVLDADAWPGAASLAGPARATILGEALRSEGATVLASFAGGHLAGMPAIARTEAGAGHAWYVGTVPSPAVLARVLHDALDAAGVEPVLPGAREIDGLEVVQRGAALFLLNHSADEVQVKIPAPTTDLLTGALLDGEAHVPATGALVLVERTVPARPSG
jgi:beta-galactosidase